MPPLPTYRPDIDGLRAVAVLAVLLSHLQLPNFGGGYIGVDIFFVISGYVIYGDCLRRAAAGGYSVSGFLNRRARRLLPQLFVMCAAVLAVGSFLLLPSDFIRLPARIFASATGISNWLFAAQSGYFMPSSEWNPVLHTWTLSVEVQFYLVFPFVLIALAKWQRRGLTIGLSGLFILSLLYCLWPRGTDAPYYDSLARIWEFLLGALLHHAGPPRLSRRTASLLSASAIAAIGTSIAMLARDAFFPDWRALVPTAATAVLILTLRESVFAELFESRPAVRLGQMSYSIYMWHWPIIVFSAYVWPDAVGVHWKAMAVLIATLIVSTAMWQWVEEPVRRRSTERARPATNQLLLAGFVAICAMCAIAWKTDGWRARFDDRTVQLDRYTDDINPRREQCHVGKFSPAKVANPCVYGASVPPEFAFWSDSHGVELIAAVTPWLKSHEKSGAQFSFSSCAPHDPPALLNDCDRFNRTALARIMATPSIRTVVLAGATDEESYRHNTAWMGEFTSAAQKLLGAGKRLIIVYPIPMQSFPAPRALANAHRFSNDYARFQTRRSDYLTRTRTIFSTYDALGTNNVVRVYPHRHLCGSESCTISDGYRPYYFDDNHLSLYGAQQLVPALTLAMDSK